MTDFDAEPVGHGILHLISAQKPIHLRHNFDHCFLGTFLPLPDWLKGLVKKAVSLLTTFKDGAGASAFRFFKEDHRIARRRLLQENVCLPYRSPSRHGNPRFGENSCPLGLSSHSVNLTRQPGERQSTQHCLTSNNILAVMY